MYISLSGAMRIEIQADFITTLPFFSRAEMTTSVATFTSFLPIKTVGKSKVQWERVLSRYN